MRGTSGKARRSKASALKNKGKYQLPRPIVADNLSVWETSKTPASNANPARKRSASSVKEPEGIKRVKPATTSGYASLKVALQRPYPITDPQKPEPPKRSSSSSKLQLEAAQVEDSGKPGFVRESSLSTDSFPDLDAEKKTELRRGAVSARRE
jgi:hypothetical protein